MDILYRDGERKNPVELQVGDTFYNKAEDKLFIRDKNGYLLEVCRRQTPHNNPSSGFKNILINGDFKINQRGITSWSVGKYAWDRWMLDSLGEVTQPIEDGSYKPDTIYTLSKDGVKVKELRSPASGVWRVSIGTPSTNPQNHKWQLEEGTEATPFEVRPNGYEVGLCLRYYQKGVVSCPRKYAPRDSNWIEAGSWMMPHMRGTPTVKVSGGTYDGCQLDIAKANSPDNWYLRVKKDGSDGLYSVYDVAYELDAEIH